MIDSKQNEKADRKEKKEKTEKTISKKQQILRFVMVTMGALTMALSLKLFFIPAGIIDGGITGISLMISHTTGLSLSILLALLNLPFIYLGYKQIGKTFAITTLYSIIVMSIGTTLFEGITPLTHDPFLDAMFGGVLIGAGVGTVIKNGGALDGTEIVAVKLSNVMSISVGQVVMIANIFILGTAAFVFGFENAMYSLVAYFVASRVIDLVNEGGSELKTVFLVTSKPDEIGDALLSRLGRGVTYIPIEGGYSGERSKMIYTVISRIEERKLKDIVHSIDKNAFFVANEANEVFGGHGMKKDIH